MQRTLGRPRLPASFRPPVIVWTLTLLGFLLSACASLTLPVYLGYDEPQHVDMVVALAHGDGWAAPGERKLGRGVAVSSNFYNGAQVKKRPLDEAFTLLEPRGERQTLADLGGDRSAGGRPNQMVQHPPLYYAIEAVALKAFGADDWPFDKLVMLLRLVTALLVAPLPLLVWGIAHRLNAGAGVAVAASALTLAVPGMTRVAGLVNNDGFLVVTTAALLLGVVHVATGDLTRRTAIVVGLLTGLALLAKGFALGLPVVVIVAYALGVRRLGGRLVTGALPLAIALGVGFLTGGVWWVRNLVLYGALQPQGFGPVALAELQGPPRASDNPATLEPYLTALHDRLARTFWGGVGTASQPTLTKYAGSVLFLLVAVALVVGLTKGVRDRPQRGVLAMILLPLPLALAIVVQGSYGAYVAFAKLPGLQGRYLYLAVGGLAVVTAIAVDRLLGPARRALPLLAVAAALVMQAVHSYRLVRELWLPDSGGSLRAAFGHLRVVSPWSETATNLTFGVTVLVALVALALSAQRALPPLRRSTTPRPAEPVAAGDAVR